MLNNAQEWFKKDYKVSQMFKNVKGEMIQKGIRAIGII